MESFVIAIAGQAISVAPLFESTRFYCRAYLTEAEPAYFVRVSPEDLLREQAALLAEAKREGLRPRTFPDPFLERSVIQRKIADLLLAHRVLLLHGSTVAVDGQAYLFTAHCGTGKSTHTRLWRQVFGDRAVMINDDKPFLTLAEGPVLASGSPWSGKHGLDTNLTVPLKGVCILRRGPENRIDPLTPEEGLPMLVQQSNDAALADLLSRRVPLWQMECTRDPQAALVAWEAMHL